MSSTSWVETAGARIRQTSGRLCGQAMTAVIVSVNNELFLQPAFSASFLITTHMLAKSMGDLNYSAGIVMTAPISRTQWKDRHYL